MKKGFFCFAMLLSGFSTVGAQGIRGSVADGNREPVPDATVVLQTVDSVFVEAACTDSTGCFYLKADFSVYRLIVQHVLYETYERSFSGEYEPEIVLTERENRLGEVLVKGRRPAVRLVDGKITYDMPLLLSGKAVSNAYESVLQLPGVREQDGLPTLAGAGSVTVVINGQATSMPYENLMAALKMYPADRIQSAEIMYSAPPQYHVRGAVINLVLKEDNSGEGLQGQFRTAFTQRHYEGYTTGVSLLLPAGRRWTTDFHYAFARNRSRSGMDLYSNHRYQGLVNRIEQFNRGSRTSNDHHVRLGADFKLTEQDDRVHFVYTSQITAGVSNRERSTGTFSDSENRKGNRFPIQMHHVLSQYSSGFGLKAGVEYTSYGSHTRQHFMENKSGMENGFVADAGQEIRRYRFFADQSHALPSDRTIRYGAGYVYATDNSFQTYFASGNGDLSGMNLSSRLREYTASAYAGFEKRFGPMFSLSASLTGEFYRLGGFSEWTLFPAMEVTWLVSPSHILQLSFSSDKVYPAYWEMHGAVSFMNAYSEIHGNPLLKPYRYYAAQLNYMLNNSCVITFYGNYLNNYFAQLPYQAPDKLSLIYKTLNFDYKQTAGVNLTLPFNVGKAVSSRLTLNGFYDRVKSAHFHDISFAKDRFVFYSRSDNTVHLSSRPDIKLEVSGAYISGNIQGPAELTALWNLDTGLKWTFFRNRAELSLKATDLFNSWTPDLIMQYHTQDLRMNILPDARAVSLSFIYKLGGYDKTHKEIDSSRFGTE
jgi:hypothetical protein